MKREIKFRAWDKIDKLMFSQVKDISWLGHSDNINLINAKRFTGQGLWGVMTRVLRGREYELMEYTGLKDRKGKEIYEGDLIENSNIVFEVMYRTPSFVLSPQKDNNNLSRKINKINELSDNFIGHKIVNGKTIFKIVGNIYETRTSKII